MKKIQFTLTVHIALSLLSYTMYSQTGVFTYNSNNNLLPNAAISSIIEKSDGNISLLNMCSDAKYHVHSIQLSEVGNNGNLIKNTNINVPDLHELTTIKGYGNNKYAIFGNSKLNKEYTPFQYIVNENGEVITKNELPQVYSTLICDVISYENYFMLLYSKVGKNNLYNISLHKINQNDGGIIWLRKISSENNEEADKILVSKNGNFYILGKKYNDNVSEFIPIIYCINSNGEQLWKKALDVPTNFNNQSLLLDNGSLIYVCSYTKSQTGFSESLIYKLSASGDIIHNNGITEFSANGIIAASQDTYLIYGSEFIVDQKQVVTKGKYVILNEKLSDIYIKALDANDKPDAGKNWNTKSSSDFTTAYKLTGNRIALGGKVFMPDNSNKGKYNASLLMIVNKDGSY